MADIRPEGGALMLPTEYNDGLPPDFEIAEQPTRTYRLRFDGYPSTGMLTGQEAMRQAVFLALQTERFRHAIYSWNYGVELETLFGEGITPYLQVRIRRAIEGALLADDRITQVDGFSFARTGRERLAVTFTVHSTQGDFSASYELEGGAVT